MSAVTHHLPQVGYFDWSEFADFDERQKARAIRLLREATRHVERLTLRQAIAEAAESQQVKDASVWAAFLALWLQIRDGAPHSERQLMQVLDEYESDMGWTARAARELIQNAIDAYHTTRIDRHVAEFEVGRFEAGRGCGHLRPGSAPGGNRQALAGRRGPASRAQSGRDGLAETRAWQGGPSVHSGRRIAALTPPRRRWRWREGSGHPAQNHRRHRRCQPPNSSTRPSYWPPT